jgi:membrane-bound ClpP family serine protease
MMDVLFSLLMATLCFGGLVRLFQSLRRRVVGRRGVVVEASQPYALIRVDGQSWRAVAADGGGLEVGEQVVVSAVKGLEVAVVDRRPTVGPPEPGRPNVAVVPSSQSSAWLGFGVLALVGSAVLAMIATVAFGSYSPQPVEDAASLGIFGFLLVLFLDLFVFVYRYLVFRTRRERRGTAFRKSAGLFLLGLLAAPALGSCVWFWSRLIDRGVIPSWWLEALIGSYVVTLLIGSWWKRRPPS